MEHKQMMTQSDYPTLYRDCETTKDQKSLAQLERVCKAVLANTTPYQVVQKGSGVPWLVVACIHFRESDQNFRCHLHNGDPLTARTVRFPPGRPEKGEAPFEWHDSAIDAFINLWRPKSWSLPGALEFMERYNGLGYRKHGVKTPYLWDFTNQYSGGLFVADGSLDMTKRENRPGIVAILKTLESKGVDLGLPDDLPARDDLH
jgi:lysozyme family protein